MENKSFTEVSIFFYPGGSVIPVRMTFCVPDDCDPEEYIDDYLDGLLNDFLRYNSEWNFA